MSFSKSSRKLRHQLMRLIARRQSLWSLSSNGVSAVAGLLIFMMSSSRLSSAEFGAWVFFQAMSTLFDMLRTGLILPGFLQQSAGQLRQVKRSIYQSAFILYGLFSGLQLLLCLLLSSITETSSALHFFASYYPIILLTSTFVTLTEWSLQTNNQFHLMLIFRFINRISLLGICYFFLDTNADMIYAQGVSNVISWISLPLLGVSMFPKVHEASVQRVKNLLHFGKYSTPSQIASTLLRSSDTFMISAFLGSVITGIYGAAAKFLEFFELPIRSAASVHFNQLAALIKAGKTEQGVKFTIQKIGKGTMVVAPVAILLSIFAPELVQFASGNQYFESVPVLRMMAVYCLLIPADRYTGLFLEAMGKPQLNLVKVCGMLVLNVVTNLIALIVFQSAFAVAFTSVLTFLSGIILGAWLIKTKALPQQAESFSIKGIILLDR